MAENPDPVSTTEDTVVSEKQDYSSADRTATQEQILMRALQKLLMDPERKNDQTPSRPEAIELINRFKNLASGIEGSTNPWARTVVPVSWDEEDNVILRRLNIADGPPEVNSIPPWPISEEPRLDNDNPRNQAISRKPHTPFHDKLLRALREHVFNKMPIRLLHLEHLASGFQISLVERGEIYTYLESTMRAKMYGHPDYQHKLIKSLDQMETDQQAIERVISNHARYAILSHTWFRPESSEVTYSDWNKGCFGYKGEGLLKLVKFCKIAWKDHRLAFGWMDTVCINKESSSELDESIRSMYNWYKRANMCVVYLSRTKTLSEMHVDTWFTRGWTLQELLAPDAIKFYDSHWKQLKHSEGPDTITDKKDTSILEEIKLATTISEDELNKIHSLPLSRRMQLAATREVTREEDTAYSLMGLFNVSIAIAYGEGAERAFFRLLREILDSCSEGILDLFNWAGELPTPRPHTTRILPSSPQHYLHRSLISLKHVHPIKPLTLTHMGLRVPVLLMPGISVENRTSHYKAIGSLTAALDISPTRMYSTIPKTYRLLDKRVGGRDGSINRSWHQYTFAVLNIEEEWGGSQPQGIRIPQKCIAVALECHEHAGKVSSRAVFDYIETEVPIMFELETKSKEGSKFNVFELERSRSTGKFCDSMITIKPKELPGHGMQLLSMYM